MDAREMNEHLFDIGITAVHQCEQQDGTCEFHSFELKFEMKGGREGESRRLRS